MSAVAADALEALAGLFLLGCAILAWSPLAEDRPRLAVLLVTACFAAVVACCLAARWLR